MAEERAGTRDFDTRKNLSWTELLRTFLIALDPFKLVAAAAGIMIMAFGWWLLSVIYFNLWSEPKGYGDDKAREVEIKDRKDGYVKDGKSEEEALTRATAEYNLDLDRYKLMRNLAGPGGSYRTMPWFENRGRNPFVLTQEAVTGGYAERNKVLNWFVGSQLAVLIEPLLKFLGPVIGLFDPAADFWVRLYLFGMAMWMLAVWAFFGGVITRMAIVQIAGKEGGGLRDAITFVKSRYITYLASPIVPIVVIFIIAFGLIVFGLFEMIPIVGDVLVAGLLWCIPLGAGFVMALLVVGLVGYPLMYTTLSAEGSDAFDALSRSYNYVYESPWSYIWYSLVALLYGAVVVFFVVFMTSLMAYMGKWGVAQTPWTQAANRSPEYLFIYTPTSFGWRELMLQGSPAAGEQNPNYGSPMPGEPTKIDMRPFIPKDQAAAAKYMDSYHTWEYMGAGMVGFWMTLLFMLMLGFSYSYFWTAASMIYLLMRKKVDEVEVDEIYTEDEDLEEPVAPPKLSTPPAATAPSSVLVDAPTLRAPPAAPSAPPPAAPPPPTPPTSEAP
jgi:hypothetical protein